MKRYVVTDPCYACEDSEVWNRICAAIFSDEYNPDYVAGDVILSEYLGTPVSMYDTGFGDWSNHIYGKNVEESEFYADAGMVCVMELTDRVLAEFKAKKFSNIPGAVFTSEGIDISTDVAFDDSDSNWTVLHISTPEGEIVSEYPEEDYEEDDFFEGDDDFDEYDEDEEYNEEYDDEDDEDDDEDDAEDRK